MLLGLSLPMLDSPAGLTFEEIVVTQGASSETISAEFFSYVIVYAGFRTATGVTGFGGSPATFGSRSPTTFNAVTIEEAYAQSVDSSPYAFRITLNGDLTAGTPFTKIEFMDGTTLEATLQRADATTPAGVYDGVNTCTHYDWNASVPWLGSGSRTMRVYY